MAETSTTPIKYSWRDHKHLFIATGIMILSPFQYGIDFGMIGGLQAMVPFLQVCRFDISASISPNTCIGIRLRMPEEDMPYGMEHPT
jgi:hypothetical protein